MQRKRLFVLITQLQCCSLIENRPTVAFCIIHTTLSNTLVTSSTVEAFRSVFPVFYWVIDGT